MDFTLIEKVEQNGICYKLLRATFYKGYYAIIAQSKKEFFCSSFHSCNLEAAKDFFREISNSDTEIYTLRDIICDFEKQRI